MDENLKSLLTGLNKKIDWVIANYPRENLLDNWYFADPINSRGETSYTSSASNKVYCIDRWYLELKDGMTVTRRVGNGLELAQNSSSGKIYQKLQELRSDLTYTLSVYTSDSTKPLKTLKFNNILMNGDTDILSYNSSANTVAITLTSGITLYAAKLEVGVNSTLLNEKNNLTAIPNKAMELCKCYYFDNDTDDIYTNYKVYEVRTNEPQHLKTIWIDSGNNNIAKIYYNGNWVEAFGGKQFAIQASAPDTNKLWIDSNNSNVIKFYNGTDWVTCSGAWG